MWKIDDLMKTILSEVEAREISERAKTTNERKLNFPNNRSSNQYRNNNPGTSSALYSREGDNTYNSNKIRCAYCHDFHLSASCEKIKDPKQRKEILRKEGRCFVCLRIGHRGSECQRTCRRCNGKHHQSIYMKSADKNASNQQSREHMRIQRKIKLGKETRNCISQIRQVRMLNELKKSRRRPQLTNGSLQCYFKRQLHMLTTAPIQNEPKYGCCLIQEVNVPI